MTLANLIGPAATYRESNNSRIENPQLQQALLELTESVAAESEAYKRGHIPILDEHSLHRHFSVEGNVGGRKYVVVSDLVVIEFPSEAEAEAVRWEIIHTHNEYLIELEDAVVASGRQDKIIKLNHLCDLTEIGKTYGSLHGMLLFLMLLPGVATDATAGMIRRALSDIGVSDQFMQEVAEVIRSGNAVLFLLIRKGTTYKVLADFKGAGGKILHASFDQVQENALSGAVTAASAKALMGPRSLSPREREVLSWAAQGKTTQEISETLGITPRTVEEHVTAASRKLGAANRTHAVAIALAASASSVRAATSGPVRVPVTFRPSSPQTCRVTCSLSPVSTFRTMPKLARAVSASRAPAFGGSRKA
ncbi:MAG: LuxR C-terminal-related transcriptional regulator, partial [Xanthobacteraceae bacterium]